MNGAEQTDDGSSDTVIHESLAAVAALTAHEVRQWQAEALAWAETDVPLVPA